MTLRYNAVSWSTQNGQHDHEELPGGGKPRPLAGQSDLSLLRDFQRIVDLYSQVANRAFKFAVAK